MTSLPRHRSRRVPGAIHEPDDSDLIAALATSDGRALDELVTRHGARVRGYLLRLVRDSGWADDLTQEVFVRVYERACSFDSDRSVQVWLFSIARNLAIDLVRREGLRSARRESVAPNELVAARTASAEQRELANRLEHAIAMLPESFRSVFVLRELEGLSYEEIAEVLGLSAKTVSSRLHRCRSELKRQLKELLE